MAVQSMTLPYKVEAKLRAFLDARVDGSVVLDIKRGEILACKITESFRVDKADGSTVN
jgi:hypothetical protein